MDTRYRLFPIAGILLPRILLAQIVIGPADMPGADDTLRYRNTSAVSVDLDATGPEHVWDLRTLAPMDEGADTTVQVSATPLLYQFYFNNPFLYPDHRASFAMAGPSFGLQGAELDDVYDYYASDAAGFRNVGFGARVNGIPVSVRQLPVDRVYRFPLGYGDADSSASSFLITVPGIGSLGRSQVRHNMVDGWGTLYLPADTFEVLRVRSVIQRIDTVFIDQLGLGFSFPEPETIEYKWLAHGEGQPVLQATTVAGFPATARFVYRPEDITTDVAQRDAMTGPAVWPNPATDVLHVRSEGRGGALEWLGADGRVVRRDALRAGMAVQDMYVHDLAPGIYGLREAGLPGVTRVVVPAR